MTPAKFRWQQPTHDADGRPIPPPVTLRDIPQDRVTVIPWSPKEYAVARIKVVARTWGGFLAQSDWDGSWDNGIAAMEG